MFAGRVCRFQNLRLDGLVTSLPEILRPYRGQGKVFPHWFCTRIPPKEFQKTIFTHEFRKKSESLGRFREILCCLSNLYVKIISTSISAILFKSFLGKIILWELKTEENKIKEMLNSVHSYLTLIKFFDSFGKLVEYYICSRRINLNRFVRVFVKGGGSDAILLTSGKEVIPA